ncbi:MAG: AmmeMemoRadiSam system radical SAM enzyme [Thermoguttaceae bacterium]|nr:AmmeMemoRadiSam system radical SAM enzyme [Thermoguttaceae bacterium]
MNDFSRSSAPFVPVDARAIRAGTVPARWFSVVEPPPSRATRSAERPVYSLSPRWAAFGNTGLAAPSPSAAPNVQNALTPASAVVSSNRSNDANGSVDCELCFRRCRIAPGRAGFCSARVNVGGSLRARFYGRPVSVAVDPIEKKPLHHFLPGTPILSLGTFGCNLSCQFCQNWQISRAFPLDATPRSILEPEAVVETALARGCPSVAFTYNEPTIWAEYVVDVARLCRQAGLKTVTVTNGTIIGKARDEFFDVVDAANVDLKAFSEAFYRNLTGGSLAAVWETLEHVAKNTSTWLEITNLLIPTKNTAPDETARLCDRIVERLGSEIPLHFSAFFPAYRLPDVPPTPPETVRAAVEIARKSGVRYVYSGNVADSNNQTTLCPDCGTPLIVRSGYATQIAPELTTVAAARRADASPPADAAVKERRFERFCGVCGRGIAGVFERSR